MDLLTCKQWNNKKPSLEGWETGLDKNASINDMDWWLAAVLGSSIPCVHIYRLEMSNIINRPHLQADSRLPHQKYEWWLVHLKRRMFVAHSWEAGPSKQNTALSKKGRVHSCCFSLQSHLSSGGHRGGNACFYPNDNCCQCMKSFPLCTESLDYVTSIYFPRLTTTHGFSLYKKK